MKLGTVKFYDKEKGFGFITSSNGGYELRVYAHGVIDTIESNNIVQFDVEQTKLGVEAVKVTVLSA
ncbi:cold-shock protein [Pedobacter fastidiosus]|uniref:Cold shock domain-containing protein n=1 Tax=Pedobacter fastidiosus TaxID=2765361 RepID=A0ABR7KWW5_9SPHI|nr:cold shock domain-containing protein [Pedobacter fastidiosus]MBC6112601.1 cold shock domain-containing protein [Pedobacter fastidiosus]